MAKLLWDGPDVPGEGSTTGAGRRLRKERDDDESEGEEQGLEKQDDTSRTEVEAMKLILDVLNFGMVVVICELCVNDVCILKHCT